MTTYPLKFERLAIAFLATFVIADLWQHPQLSPGIIETTLIKAQETVIHSSN